MRSLILAAALISAPAAAEVTPYEIYNELQENINLEPDQEIEVCVIDQCETFYYYGLRKAEKKVPNKAQKIKEVLEVMGKGVSGGGTVKLDSIKVDKEGNIEIKGVEIKGGVGVGAEPPASAN